MSDRPLICGFLKVRNEVIREGNIYRALQNMDAFCDVIVACDDASSDGTAAVLAAHPKVTLLRVPPAEQDFRQELAVKQVMLQEVHKLQPHFVWWHDGDEELSAEGVQGIRELCEGLKNGGPPAWRFIYKQLWRSAQWVRMDGGFGDGAFVKLWRWRPDLTFDVRPGTHHFQFPKQIMEVLPQVPTAPWPVIHWGNFGKNLVWKCIQYHGGLGGVERHLNFEGAQYASLVPGVAADPVPASFTLSEKQHILGMTGLRRTPGWFTVVVPTYNRGALLTRTLQSLLDQTYKQWIALVLDDGSTDYTPRLMRDWQDADARIFYARYEANRGGVAVNEIGMDLACEFTEYWTRLGSDDFFDPTKLELDAWALAQGVDAVYGPYQVLRHGSRAEVCNLPVRPSLTQQALFNGTFAASWANIAVRTSALQRVKTVWGRFADPRLRNMEDFLVNARIGHYTDGFHFRGVVDGARVLVRTDYEAAALEATTPQGLAALRARVTADAVWNVGADGASSNGPVTSRDDAMTRIIIREDQTRARTAPPPAPVPEPVVPVAPVPELVVPAAPASAPPPLSSVASVLAIAPPPVARHFWQTASGFPKNKEEVYPEHGRAHGFDRHQNQDVLEYGCGGGSDAASWMRRSNRVIATDIVPVNVRTTQEYLDEVAKTTTHLCTGHAVLLEHTTPLPFGDHRFDVVSSHGVVHHIQPPGPSFLLQEFHRILRPGGHVYIMLYTEHLLEHFKPRIAELVRTRRLMSQQAFGWCTDGEGCPWADAYTVAEGTTLLQKAGFTDITEVTYHNRFFRTFQGRK